MSCGDPSAENSPPCDCYRFKKEEIDLPWVGCTLANVFGKGFPDAPHPYQGLIWGTHQGVAVPAQKLVLKVRPKAGATTTAPTIPPAGKVVSICRGKQ